MYQKGLVADKLKRQSIGEEKRRWRIKFYNSDGKPDKRRRPGRAWDAEAVAGPEKATYTAGHGVDLAAGCPPAERVKAATVSAQAAVDNALAELSLQTYLDQVNHYEKLLEPLMDIMQRTVGMPGAPPPQQQGWGPEGGKLTAAMQDIGAIPATMPDEAPGADNLRQKRKERVKLSQLASNGLSAIDEDDTPASRRRSTVTEKASRKGEVGVADALAAAAVDEAAAQDAFEQEEAERRAQRERERKERDTEYQEKRKQRRRERKREAAVIPWALLDALDGEKQKFEKEKHYMEFAHKY